jgi:hypothetical protein
MGVSSSRVSCGGLKVDDQVAGVDGSVCGSPALLSLGAVSRAERSL